MDTSNERVIRALKAVSEAVADYGPESFVNLQNGLSIWRTRDGQEPPVLEVHRNEPKQDGWLYFTAVEDLVDRAARLTLPIELEFEKLDAKFRLEYNLEPIRRTDLRGTDLSKPG